MELTLAEFACFNLTSKQQILDYKAIHVSSICMKNTELLLYSMNGHFIVVHKSLATGLPERIDTLVPKDMLYLFAEKQDISGLVN